jgi:hypothetical protein
VTILAVEKQQVFKDMCAGSLALGIQRATRMRSIISSSVACLAVPYLSTLSHKWHGIRKGKILNIISCVLISCTNFIRKIPHSKKTSAGYYRKFN